MEKKLKELIDRVKKGNHTQQDIVILSEIARNALKYMVEKNIPVIPENYQLWFYTFGTLIAQGHKRPTEEELVKTYNRICKELKSSISIDVLHKIQQRTREILHNSSNLIATSVNLLEEFDDKLNLITERTKQLEENKDLKNLISALTEEIHELRKENRTLTSELRNASKRLAQLHEKLAMHVEQASTDFLTKVLTRGAFERLLTLKLDNLKKTGVPFSLIMIDPDNFKKINDNYGHLAGDEVLKTLAFTLKLAVREDDIVARYGGDEFAVVVSSHLDEAVKIAERLKSNIEKLRILWNDLELRITASFGIAQARHEDTVTSLIHRADRALYLAKRSGKNTIKTERDLEDENPSS